MTYYNEIDHKPAEWIRELIKAGHLPAGDVDERSIEDVEAKDLAGYDQCHFFAGIGGWPYALRLAGWPDDRPVWTGSCPCQPLSCAGRGQGHADKRHLWPAFYKLIAECRPATVFGEQVASKLGREWFAGVRLDMEDLGYACGAADLCAAGVGAPHRRQRLFWVADAEGGNGRLPVQRRKSLQAGAESFGSSEAGGLADAEHDGGRADEPGRETQGREADGRACGVGNARRRGLPEPERNGGVACQEMGTSEGKGFVRASNDGSIRLADAEHAERGAERAEHGEPYGRDGLGRGGDLGWSRYDILPCRDGKARRVESGPQQMADGFSEVLGYLRPGSVIQIEKEITDAKITETAARKALLDLWMQLASQAIQRTAGRLDSVQQAPVLLAIMRELSRQGWHFLDHLPPECWKTPEAGLRALREVSNQAPCSSSGRESCEQHADESTNAVSIVSQAIARQGDLMIPFPLAHGIPGRVGLLRGYGNAIVPQVAAEFISAAMGEGERR